MSVNDKMVEAGLAYYSEGGCSGLAEYERREVVTAIIEAALAHREAEAGQVKAHPLEAYADSYAQMGRMGDGNVDCRSVEVDIRQNMIPVTQALTAASPAVPDRRISCRAGPPRLLPCQEGMAWREITEEDRPPNDTDVIMGCWEVWPKQKWVVEVGHYGSTRGGWIHGRMTHWLALDYLPSAPPPIAAMQEAAEMATEQEYDDIIAPMLLEVAKRCDELGMSLIARVEWEPGQSGITQIGDFSSIGQYMTRVAAHSHGNIDKLCLTLLKTCDVSQSLFLAKHQEGR